MRQAQDLVRRAHKLQPKNIDVKQWLQYVATKAGKSVEEVLGEGLGPDDSVLRGGLPTLQALVEMVRDQFADHIDGFLEQMHQSEQRLREFLGSESLLYPNRSFLLVQRKWNSFTPVVPSTDEQRSLGGGYFLYHNCRGTVIDPGYNFIENFCQAGGRVTDIDSIVLTHAHNDHTADFESLMTLLYEYNEQNGYKLSDSRYKRVTAYLNTGALVKFSGLLDLRGCPYFERVLPMSPGNRYTLDGGPVLTVLPAYHDELVTKQYAVGLHLELDTLQGTRTLLFTSDTGLYPRSKLGGRTVADTGGKEIHDCYREIDDGVLVRDIDLLVTHIGSIREDEIKQVPGPRLEGVFYPNHLGVLGTCRMITAINPRLAVVSEFGEELRTFRPALLQLIAEVVQRFHERRKETPPRVIPGDLPLVYDLAERSLYCIYSDRMVPAERACFVHDGDTFFFYDEQCDPAIKKIAQTNERYRICLQERRLPYLCNWDAFHPAT